MSRTSVLPSVSHRGDGGSTEKRLAPSWRCVEAGEALAWSAGWGERSGVEGDVPATGGGRCREEGPRAQLGGGLP